MKIPQEMRLWKPKTPMSNLKNSFNHLNALMMKKIQTISLIVSLFFLTTLSCVAQSMDDFFKFEGVQTLANLAHPAGVYVGGSYRVTSSHVIVEIRYQDNTRTKLKLHRNKDFFTGIQVLEDTDWFPPFAGVFFMKEILLELSEETADNNMNKVTPAYEQYLRKKVHEFNGVDCSILILTAMWLNY